MLNISTPKDEEIKGSLIRWLTHFHAYGKKFDLLSFRKKQITPYPAKYTRYSISDIVTSPDINLPKDACYQIYRARVDHESFEHEYKKEKMMFSFNNDVKYINSGEFQVYTQYTWFDDKNKAFVRDKISEPSLRKLVDEKNDKKVSWKDIEQVLYPLSILHVSTPAIMQKERSIFYEALDIMNDAYMGISFSENVQKLLRGGEKTISVDDYHAISDVFMKLAGSIFFNDRSSLSLINGSTDIDSVSCTQILYAGDTKHGPFFCDLALLLDTNLICPLNSDSILQRVDEISSNYPIIRKKIERYKQARTNLINGKYLGTQLKLAGVWQGVVNAWNLYNYQSPYAYASDKNGFQIKITKEINDNIALAEALLDNLKKEGDHKIRSAELYAYLDKVKFFDTFVLKKPALVFPVPIKNIEDDL